MASDAVFLSENFDKRSNKKGRNPLSLSLIILEKFMFGYLLLWLLLSLISSVFLIQFAVFKCFCGC